MKFKMNKDKPIGSNENTTLAGYNMNRKPAKVEEVAEAEEPPKKKVEVVRPPEPPKVDVAKTLRNVVDKEKK